MALRTCLVVPIVLSLAGCGDHEVAPATSDRKPAVAPVPVEREVISEADAADIATQNLARRDVPLAVGDVAPRFAGYPEKSRAVIVFFRGEW